MRVPSLLLLLRIAVLVVLQSACTTGATVLTAGKELRTTGHGKSHVLYTLSNTYGNGLELALVMALESINADPTILVDVELRIHASNTGCSKDIAVLALLKQM